MMKNAMFVFSVAAALVAGCGDSGKSAAAAAYPETPEEMGIAIAKAIVAGDRAAVEKLFAEGAQYDENVRSEMDSCFGENLIDNDGSNISQKQYLERQIAGREVKYSAEVKKSMSNRFTPPNELEVEPCITISGNQEYSEPRNIGCNGFVIRKTDKGWRIISAFPYN